MDEEKIVSTLEQFSNAFDRKDWSKMEACLAEEIVVDYSSFRKSAPASLSRYQYVKSRISALEGLKSTHLLEAMQVRVLGHMARCECRFVIKRFKNNTQDFFHSYGTYSFELLRNGGDWVISKITQQIERNEGNPHIHGTFKTA